MKNSRPRLFRAAFGAALMLATLTAVQAEDAATRGPQPDLEPPQVVEAMLLALKKNTPEGIAELYRFSSPGNRQQTGNLEQFTRMIVEGFPDMLGHEAARMAPPLIDGDRAMVPVQLISEDATLYEYMFILSRQAIPECQGCWMADAVVPPEALAPEGAPGSPPAEQEATPYETPA